MIRSDVMTTQSCQPSGLQNYMMQYIKDLHCNVQMQHTLLNLCLNQCGNVRNVSVHSKTITSEISMTPVGEKIFNNNNTGTWNAESLCLSDIQHTSTSK